MGFSLIAILAAAVSGAPLPPQAEPGVPSEPQVQRPAKTKKAFDSFTGKGLVPASGCGCSRILRGRSLKSSFKAI